MRLGGACGKRKVRCGDSDGVHRAGVSSAVGWILDLFLRGRRLGMALAMAGDGVLGRRRPRILHLGTTAVEVEDNRRRSAGGIRLVDYSGLRDVVDAAATVHEPCDYDRPLRWTSIRSWNPLPDSSWDSECPKRTLRNDGWKAKTYP